MINFHGVARYYFEALVLPGELMEQRENISIQLDGGDPGARFKESPGQGPISCTDFKDTVCARKST